MPDELDLFSPHTVIFIRHQSMGLVKRIFLEDAKTKMLYYWIENLANVPQHFSLCLSPGICFSPDISVMTVKNVLFIETFEEVEKNDTYCLKEFVTSNIEGRRKAAATNLPVAENPIYVERLRIIQDLLKSYAENLEATSLQPVFMFKDEMAIGDVVTRDALSSFLQAFLDRYFGGVDEKVPSISIGEEDCFIFGQIFTYRYICFGMFPTEIAKASLMHFLTGDASEQVLVNLFILFLDPKKVTL